MQCIRGGLQFRRSTQRSKTGKGFQTAKGVVFCREFFLIPPRCEQTLLPPTLVTRTTWATRFCWQKIHPR